MNSTSSMSSSNEHSQASEHSLCSSSCETCVSKKRPRRRRHVKTASHRAPVYNHTYNRIKVGLKRSNPAAIVLWAFHKMPSKQGLTSRKVIGFLKKHYKVMDEPHRTGKSISSILRCAVDFGLLEKRGNKFFLMPKKR